MISVLEFESILSEITDGDCCRPVPVDQLDKIHVLEAAERRMIWPRLNTRADFGGIDENGRRTFDEHAYARYASEPIRTFVRTLEQLPRDGFSWISIQDTQSWLLPNWGLLDEPFAAEARAEIERQLHHRRYEQVAQWMRSLPVLGDEIVFRAPPELTEILALPWSLLAGYWEAFLTPGSTYNVVVPGAPWLMVVDCDEIAAFCWNTRGSPPGLSPTSGWMPFPVDFRELRREVTRKREYELHANTTSSR